jgi:transcriptional regulator with XRE-family HTH domain
MENSINDRVRIIIKKEKVIQKRFCEIIGISVDTLNTIFKRNSTPGSGFLIKIVENFPQYSMNWLLTGKGEMEISKVTILETNADYKERCESQKKEIEILNQRIVEKDDLIDSLKLNIKLLKKGKESDAINTRKQTPTSKPV